MSEAKADTVPGLGFKDKDKALETIKNLEGRDPDYQKLAIKGLIGRAKRVLTLTKDKEKLNNINEAMSTFDKWLKDFEKNSRSKDNRAYLPLDSIKALLPLIQRYKLSVDKAETFLAAYTDVKGDYKNLRTAPSDDTDKVTWDIVRNRELRTVWEANIDADMWTDDGLPTKEHMEMIAWAFSPEASKIKKTLDSMRDKLGGSKRKPDVASSSDSSSSTSEDEESPKKKSKK